MARDYVEILKRIEAHYPQALGTTANADAALKQTITGFANDLIAEIDNEQRWSLSFAEPNFTTVNGTQSYALPFPTGANSTLLAQRFIDRMWYEDPSTGRIVRLQRFDKEQLQRVFGDVQTVNGAFINTGAPRYFTIESTSFSGNNPVLSVLLYPCPDGNGPSSGNYVINMSGYFNTPPIIEVQGTTVSSSTTLTWASGTNTYLTNLGEPTSSAGLSLSVSIRGAGNTGPFGLNDTHVTGWTAFAATTATLSVAAAATVNPGTQVFFNSQNWIIRFFPKLLIFGILREIASYYGDSEKYAIWEQRYMDQMQKLRDYEFDVSRGKDAHAVAYAGGDMSSLRTNDSSAGLVDVRGGVDF